jgi:hypothetical protein
MTGCHLRHPDQDGGSPRRRRHLVAHAVPKSSESRSGARSWIVRSCSQPATAQSRRGNAQWSASGLGRGTRLCRTRADAAALQALASPMVARAVAFAATVAGTHMLRVNAHGSANTTRGSRDTARPQGRPEEEAPGEGPVT